jgi:hypothetical protein
MTLSFKEHFPDGSPTYFLQKIVFTCSTLFLVDGDYLSIMSKMEEQKPMIRLLHPSEISPLFKYHSIREDKSERWKEGNKIHFVIRNRRPNRFQFLPVIQVSGVQKIKIRTEKILTPVNDVPYEIMFFWIDGEFFGQIVKDPDGVYIVDSSVARLAINDGLTVKQFYRWFADKMPFDGKIIHWSEIRY